MLIKYAMCPKLFQLIYFNNRQNNVKLKYNKFLDLKFIYKNYCDPYKYKYIFLVKSKTFL